VWVNLLTAMVSGALVLAGVVYTQRQIAAASRRAADLDADARRRETALGDRKVDAEAFDRARRYDQEVVEGLRKDLRRAREEITALRTTLDAERTEHHQETRELRTHIDRLERTVARLTRRLVDAGFDVTEERTRPDG